MTDTRAEAFLATPVGTLCITGDDRQVERIRIDSERRRSSRPDAPAVLAAAEQLEAWFEGALTSFDLALAEPRTVRGVALRAGLLAVPHGVTVSYGALARQLGSSARAIGQLCARNPYPIVVPCHRVLATGGLGHYSAGDGITTKRWLLDHEARSRLND
jgi:methylated-DNA-[protein]-cysteine S-methyltransferase